MLRTTFPLLEMDVGVPSPLVLRSSLIDLCPLLLPPISDWNLNLPPEKFWRICVITHYPNTQNLIPEHIEF
jgi:hypothetical protein